MADDLPRFGNPGELALILARRLYEGQETPGRLGRSALSGSLELPSAYASLLAMSSKGLEGIQPHVLPETQPYITQELSDFAAKQKQWARDKAGMPEGPQTTMEHAANAAGGAVLDPLSYVGAGVGRLAPLVKGLIPNAGLSVAADAALGHPDAAPAPHAAEKPPIVTTSSPPDGLGFVPDNDGLGFVADEGMSRWEKAGLGAAGVVGAALLGRRLLPKGQAGKEILPIGNAAEAADHAVGATTGREATTAVQFDKASLLESQANRSLPLQPREGQDVFTTGVPEAGTYGAFRTVAPNPAGPIVLPDLLPANATKKEINENVHKMVTEADPAAVALTTDELKRTGRLTLPGGESVDLPAFYGLVDEASMKGPEFLAKLQKVFSYERALDDFARTGEAPTLSGLLGSRNMVTTPSGARIPNDVARGGVDPYAISAAATDLRQLRMDPDVARIADQFKEIPKKLAELMPNYGIPASKIQAIMAAHPRYMPIGEQGKDAVRPGLFDKLRRISEIDKNVAESLSQWEAIMKASEIHGGGVQFPKSFVEELDKYMSVAMHTMYRNDAQRRLFYILRNSSDPQIKKSFTVYRGNESFGNASAERAAAPQGTNWFWDGEHNIGVKFADALMNNAFKLQPHAIRIPWLNGVRRTFQQLTTGLLMPLFQAAKGVFFDSAVANGFRPAESKNFGGLSGLLSAGTARIGLDPTNIVHNTLEGAGRILVNKSKLALSENIKRHFADPNGPGLIYSQIEAARPGFLQGFADRLSDAYTDSWYAHLRRAGAIGSTQYLEKNFLSNSLSTLEKVVPSWKHPGQGPGFGWHMWNGYKAIMESIAQASRVQYLAHNATRPNAVQESSELLGQFTRRGMGRVSGTGAIKLNEASDPIEKAMVALAAKGGANGFGQSIAQGLNESVPYYNVAVQAMRRIGKRIGGDTKHGDFSGLNGLVQTIGVPTMASMGLVSVMGPEYRDYMARMPGYQRASTLYIPIWGLPPERGLHIPVAPELAVFHSTIAYGMAELLGMNNGTQFYQDDIKDSLLSALNVFTPLPLTAFAAANGYQINTRAGSYQQGMLPMPLGGIGQAQREHITGVGTSNRPNSLMPGAAEDVLASLFGAAFTMVLGGAESVRAASKTPERESWIGAGLTHLGNEAMRRTPVYKPVHGFHAEASATNVKRRLGEKDKIVDQVTKMADFIMREGSVSMRDPTPLNLGMEQFPRFYNDPEFRRKALGAKLVFDRDPGLKALMQQRNSVRNQIEAQAGKRPLTAEVQQTLNVLRTRDQALVERLYLNLKSKEQLLGFPIEDLKQ